MKNFLFISFLILVGSNGFGQKINPISDLQSKCKNEYSLTEYLFKLDIEFKLENEKENYDLNPCDEYRNVSTEFDSCNVLKMEQYRLNLDILDSLDKCIKKLNFISPYFDTVYYAQITQIHFNINPYVGVDVPGVTYNTNCNLTRLQLEVKFLIRKKNAYQFKAVTHYQLIPKKLK